MKKLSDLDKLKIAVVAMNYELKLKMAGMGKQYDRNQCLLYKALKKINECKH